VKAILNLSDLKKKTEKTEPAGFGSSSIVCNLCFRRLFAYILFVYINLSLTVLDIPTSKAMNEPGC